MLSFFKDVRGQAFIKVVGDVVVAARRPTTLKV